MKLTLRQLQYATAASRLGNLSRAGSELHVSQPSITAAISQLEAQFEQLIFVRRRGSGVSLTAFGRAVIDQSQRILAEVRTLENLRPSHGEPAGRVVLGCSNELAPYFAPGLARQLQQRHPNVQLDIEEEDLVTLHRRLADGTLDYGLTYDLKLGPDIATVNLLDVRPHALMASNHPLAPLTNISLAELAAYPLIQSDQPLSWEHILDLFHRRGIAARIAARPRSFELLRSLVANGFGVAVVYSQPFGDWSYDGSSLCRRAIRDDVSSERLVLARNVQYPPTPAGMALVLAAQEWIAKRAAERVNESV